MTPLSRICSSKVADLTTLYSSWSDQESLTMADILGAAVIDSAALLTANEALRPKSTLDSESAIQFAQSVLRSKNSHYEVFAARTFIFIELNNLLRYVEALDQLVPATALDGYAQMPGIIGHPINLTLRTFFAAQASLGAPESLPLDAARYAIAARHLYFNIVALNRGIPKVTDEERIKVADLLVHEAEGVARRAVEARHIFPDVVSDSLLSLKAARNFLKAKEEGNKAAVIREAKILFKNTLKADPYFYNPARKIIDDSPPEIIAPFIDLVNCYLIAQEALKIDPENFINIARRVIAARNLVYAFHLDKVDVAPTAGISRDPSIPAASASTVDARNSTQLSALESVTEGDLDDPVSTTALLFRDADFAPDPDSLVVDDQVVLGPKTARVAPTSSTAAPQLTASAARRVRERAAAARNANKDPLDPRSVAQSSSVREVPAPSSRVVPASSRRLPSAADPDHVVDDDVEPGS